MPCKSDYLEADGKEVELSRVACLLGEFDGKPIDKSHWRGYHPAVYNKQVDGDAMVSELCERLQMVDVTKYSLEMQIWWRDHQAACSTDGRPVPSRRAAAALRVSLKALQRWTAAGGCCAQVAS